MTTTSRQNETVCAIAREYEQQGFPRGLWWDSSNYEVPGNLQSKNWASLWCVNLTNVVNPSITNEILFSASKLDLQYTFADPTKVSYAALGLQKIGFGGNSKVNFIGNNPYVPISVLDVGKWRFHTHTVTQSIRHTPASQLPITSRRFTIRTR
jgi:hypothetical protein